MADYRLKSYDPTIPGMWEYERLDEFGNLAVQDLNDFTSAAELLNGSLNNIRLFADKAADVQARRDISQDQSLGTLNDAYLTGVPHTFDGIVEKRIIARSFVPEPSSTLRTPFTVNAFPIDYEQIDTALVVTKDTVENTSFSLLETDGTTSTKEITGPTLTYRVSFEKATEINFISFFAAVPMRLLNVQYRSSGALTSVKTDAQVYGAERVYFDAATVQYIEIVVNQPSRIMDVK